jgi:S-methylmethionine-dependent homocysteine/selenocysteine methylase
MSVLADLVSRGVLVLTDGGIETRIVYESDVDLPEPLESAGLLEDPAGEEVLRDIYRSYLVAARERGLPVIIGTPTFRASPRYVAAAGRPAGDLVTLNRAAARMHAALIEETGHRQAFVAGVIGPAGDAYTPSEALDPDAGETYHRDQARALAEAGVDFLFAPTFPAVSEAIGVARAMASTGIPYAVSFVLAPTGHVLDGTPLADAVEAVDAAVDPRPMHFSLSCIHPTVAARALEAAGPDARARVRECKANASRLPTSELVQLDHLEGDDPDPFASAMWELHERFGTNVLGGCCGTDDRHMRALAALMDDQPAA